MFDNEYVLTENILDSLSDPILDNSRRNVLSRAYTGLLKKFLEGLPPEFKVADPLRDNAPAKLVHPLLDSLKENVLDNQSRIIETKYYSTEYITDSHGAKIICEGIFRTL